MMNQVEFSEFASTLLQNHTVELFCEEGSVDIYGLAEINDFVDTVFDLEASAFDVFSNGDNVGMIQLVMDSSPSKGVYVEINGSSNNEVINPLVELTEKYQAA